MGYRGAVETATGRAKNRHAGPARPMRLPLKIRSSRGVGVTKGVAQCGCSASDAATRASYRCQKLSCAPKLRGAKPTASKKNAILTDIIEEYLNLDFRSSRFS